MKPFLKSSATVCKTLIRPSLSRFSAAIPFSSVFCLYVRSVSCDTLSSFRKIVIHKPGRTEFNAYVLGKDGAPGIVVLQEWWGIEYEIKKHALKISQMDPGFRVLIPEGRVGLYVAEEHHLMDGLDWKSAIKDIRASVHWLKADGSYKVGVTGFCMGGALSIASSVLIPQVDAAVSFYGVPLYDFADPSEAKAPIQAHFGELDTFVGFSDATAAKSLEEKLGESGTPYEVHMYEGNGHAFMNRFEEERAWKVGNKGEDAVRLAWSRFGSWMNRFLCPSAISH